MEIQVAQVNKATIKDVFSIRSNAANSAVVVFKDAAAFNTAKKKIMNSPRTIHFLLKPVESGVDDYNILPPVIKINNNLHLIPGRITLSQFEGVLADRWSISPDENVLAIRTITQFRTIAMRYAAKNGYDYILVDVSPSL